MSAFLVAVAACLIDGTPFLTGAGAEAVFSTDEILQTTTAPMTSQPGRSAVDCAFKCEFSPERDCSSVVFVPETKLCLLSELQNAEFAAVAPTGLVYRKKLDKGPIHIDGRTFQVIQHRSKGVLSFARGWTQYEDGFGDDTDFWI
uniref:Apple domain-containing protein n=1 Tax=Macrostomum lignano TaxID=282301 RepID=A0A1I8H4R7_9PLAT